MKRVPVELGNTILVPNHSGDVPIVINVVKRTEPTMLAGSVPEINESNEQYVKLSALPVDLQRRITTVLEYIQSHGRIDR